MADVREANINVVGESRMPVLGELNDRAIGIKEVNGTVNEMKSGKAPGLDGFPLECLMKGGMAVLERSVILLNVNFDMGVVPMDWRGAVYSTIVQREKVTSMNIVTREVLVC